MLSYGVVLLDTLSYEVALLVFGILLMLLGLIGKIKAKEIEVGTNNKIVRIIAAILGISFILLSYSPNLLNNTDIRQSQNQNKNDLANDFSKEQNNKNNEDLIKNDQARQQTEERIKTAQENGNKAEPEAKVAEEQPPKAEESAKKDTEQPPNTVNNQSGLRDGLYYTLNLEFSGKFVCSDETNNGGKLWFWSPIPSGHEARYKFKLIAAGNNYYYLLHEFSGKYVCSGDLYNGGNLWLWGPIPTGHEARYKFKLIAAGDNYYYLLHEFSGKYVCSGDLNNGGKIWLWGPIPNGHETRYKFKLEILD